MKTTRIQFAATVVVMSVITLTGCAPSTETAWTPSPDEPRAFVTTLGTDTTTVEVYTRTMDHIEGVLVERTPYTYVVRYAADMDAAGNMTRFEGAMSTPEENPEGPEPVSWTMSLEGDSVVVSREGGGNSGTAAIEVPEGVVLSLGRASTAMFVFEQVGAQLHAAGAQGPVYLLGPTSPAPSMNTTSVSSPDSLTMDFFGSPRVGWFDDAGQLLGVSGARTTMKVETRRIPALDVEPLVARWAALDAKGEGIGVPSIPGTVAATIDGAQLEIQYSRPAKRGREIWGSLVPDGDVWRTGANAATHFASDRDLNIGGTDVPAGTYTLFSVFSSGDVTLIVNSQTGQWGTQYDALQDFAHIEMMREDLPEPVERFTIRLEDTDDGGALYLEWDRTGYYVPFQVK